MDTECQDGKWMNEDDLEVLLDNSLWFLVWKFFIFIILSATTQIAAEEDEESLDERRPSGRSVPEDIGSEQRFLTRHITTWHVEDNGTASFSVQVGNVWWST